jgi:peptidoglycan/LPS O-acetylase OafA/YrhL
MFYLTVPLFVFLFRKFSRLPILIIAYCSSIAYAEILIAVAKHTNSNMYEELSRQLPGQLSYFMAGAFLYYFLPLFERHIKHFLAGAVAVLTINTAFPLPLLEPLAIAITVIFCGLFFYLGNVGKYGDFSYGLYILHCPIIQAMLHFGWFKESPWYFLTAVFTITMAGAIAMWHLVEKRFLLRSSHYVATETASQVNPQNNS